MMKLLIVVSAVLVWSTGDAWENLPQLPAGKRAEYFLRESDGGYKYGFDTGLGSFAKQSGSAVNQVEGHFAFPQGGKLVDVRYTAGTQGYVPVPASGVVPKVSLHSSGDYFHGTDSAENGDKSYNFEYSTGGSSRHESSDSSGNVQGRFSYTDSAGSHDLTYKAGSETGFVVTGGSLAAPNGLDGKPAPQQDPAARTSEQNNESNLSSGDASYSFSYNADSSSRQESADSAGNVRGRYAYTNGAGAHDLSYEAGAEKGFIVTGGSLAEPNGLAGKLLPGPSSVATSYSAGAGGSEGQSSSNADGSYSFSYDAGSSSRQESADAAGNVRGRYAYTNDAGSHDLSYEAGAEKGFLVTGGSLAEPNGLVGNLAPGPSAAPTSYSAGAGGSDGSAQSSSNADGSYSFSYDAGSSSRQESADAAGNVRGRYGYTNDAGSHDLSYEAGAEKGFLVTGGSLAEPNGLAGKLAPGPSAAPTSYSAGAGGSDGSAQSSSNADGSYSFSYDAGSSSRQESADAAGNVRGRYGYTNDAGSHDLSYEAGAEKGFLVTGGSLAEPNGLAGKFAPRPSAVATTYSAGAGGSDGSAQSSSNADGSYSFSYDAGSSSRQESADAAGNVRGRYAYTNDAGSHDLSYEAGAEKGFLVTGGSLAEPNGLAGKLAPGPSAAPTSYSAGTGGSEGASQSSSKADGSYSFSYDAGSSSRQESADGAGNVQGRYAYTNDAGSHDLSYEAGADRGFVVTGGSLAEPNGIVGKVAPAPSAVATSYSAGAEGSEGTSQSSSNADGSYSFSYDAGSSSRQESADAAGNVQGRYAYTNDAGSHDLSYEAGSEKGFVVTGGSLAEPNGLVGKQLAVIPLTKTSDQPLGDSPSSSSSNDDGSYNFSYDTRSSSRQESSDSLGNVQGRYAYSNEAGQHDLSYEAGAEKGFVLTGGSLAIPNGLDGGATVRRLQLHAESHTSKTDGSPSDHTHLTKSYLPPLPVAKALTKSIDILPGNLKLTKYLPVDGNHKVGYVFYSH